MRVAVIGGTGFVGGYLVDALLDAGDEPALLVRPGSESKVPRQCSGTSSMAATLSFTTSAS